MIKTLWIFGDSYAIDHDQNHQWFKQLGAENIENHAIQGASNDYIAWTLAENLNKIGSDDRVIVVSTEPSREWFFKKLPELGNYLNIMDLEIRVNKTIYAALKNYVQYLYNPNTVEMRALAYESYYYETCSKLPCAGLVLPAWPQSQGRASSVKGCLGDVCNEEFVSLAVREQWYNMQVDPRPNHMTKPNHAILAKKILEHWRTGETIDFTQDFATGVIKHSQDYTFC